LIAANGRLDVPAELQARFARKIGALELVFGDAARRRLGCHVRRRRALAKVATRARIATNRADRAFRVIAGGKS